MKDACYAVSLKEAGGIYFRQSKQCWGRIYLWDFHFLHFAKLRAIFRV
jgi:hypothetical protein